MLRYCDSTSSEISSVSRTKLNRIRRKLKAGQPHNQNCNDNDDSSKRTQSRKARRGSALSTTDSDTNLAAETTQSSENDSATEVCSSESEVTRSDQNKNNRNFDTPTQPSTVVAATTTTEPIPITTSPTLVLETIISHSDSKVFDPKTFCARNDQQRNSRRPKSCRGVDGNSKGKRLSVLKKSKSCTAECDVIDPNYKAPTPKDSYDDLFFFNDLDPSQITVHSGESSDYSIGFIFRDSEDDDTITLPDYNEIEEEVEEEENEVRNDESELNGLDNSRLFRSLVVSTSPNTSLADLWPSGEKSQTCLETSSKSNSKKRVNGCEVCDKKESYSIQKYCCDCHDSDNILRFPSEENVISSGSNIIEANGTNLQTGADICIIEKNTALTESDQASKIELDHSNNEAMVKKDESGDDNENTLSNDYSIVKVKSSLSYCTPDSKSKEIIKMRKVDNVVNTNQEQTDISHEDSFDWNGITVEEEKGDRQEYFNMEEMIINCTESLGLQTSIHNLNSNMSSVELFYDNMGNQRMPEGKYTNSRQDEHDHQKRAPFPQEILDAIQKAMMNGDFQDMRCVKVEDDGIVLCKVDDRVIEHTDNANNVDSVLDNTCSLEQINKSVDESVSLPNVESSNSNFVGLHDGVDVTQIQTPELNPKCTDPGSSSFPQLNSVEIGSELKLSVDYTQMLSPTFEKSSFLVSNVMQDLEISMAQEGISSQMSDLQILSVTSKDSTNSNMDACAGDIVIDTHSKTNEEIKLNVNAAAICKNELTEFVENDSRDEDNETPRNGDIDYKEPTCSKELENSHESRSKPVDIKFERALHSEPYFSLIIPSDDNSNPDTIGSNGLASPKPRKHSNKKLKGKKIRKRSITIKTDSSRSDVEQPMKSKSKAKFLSLLLNMIDDEPNESEVGMVDGEKDIKSSNEAKLTESEETVTEIKFPRGVDSLDPETIVDKNCWVNMMKEDMERTRLACRMRRKQKQKPVLKGPSKKKMDGKRYRTKTYPGRRAGSRVSDDWDRSGVGYGDGNEDEEDTGAYGGEKTEFHPLSEDYIVLKDYYSQKPINNPQSNRQTSRREYTPANINTISNTRRNEKNLKTTRSLPGLRISKAKFLAPSVMENERIEHLKVEDTSKVKPHRNPGMWNYPPVDYYCKINRPIRGCSLESLTKYPGQHLPHLNNSSVSIIQDVTSTSFAHQKRLMYTDLLQANAARELNKNPNGYQDAKCIEALTKRQKEIEIAEKVRQKLIKFRLNEAATRKKVRMNDEDQWNSTVNEMLLMSEKVKEQKSEPQGSDNRFPRSSSARIVDAVPKKTFNFLNQLLEQDEQDQQMSEQDDNYSHALNGRLSRFYEPRLHKQDNAAFGVTDSSTLTYDQTSQVNTPTITPSFRTANHVSPRQRSQFMNNEMQQHTFIKSDTTRAPVSFSGTKPIPPRIGHRHIGFSLDSGIRSQSRMSPNMATSGGKSSSSQYDKSAYVDNIANIASVLKIKPRKYRPGQEKANESKNPLLNRYSDVFGYYHTPCLRDRADSSIVQLYDN